MNILLLSVGTRNKIIQYFRKELNGKGLVIATDANPLAPALYDADKFYIVPKINDVNYMDKIINICKENSINGVLSLIDPELRILAENVEKFIEIGVMPIVSDTPTIELCFNKFLFQQKIHNLGFKAIKTYINKEEFYRDVKKSVIGYPVFVKPINGSASININKVYSSDEIELLFKKYNNLMIQEFMDGQEYGVDVYIDMYSNDIVEMFIKEKLKMRAGETDKSVSVNNDKLEMIITNFINKINFKGAIDIDVFKVKNEYYISEVNPRFGGGYPHAYECGVNFPKFIINNLQGCINSKVSNNSSVGVYMMKYSDIIMKKSD